MAPVAGRGGNFLKLLRDQLGKIEHHGHRVAADILDDPDSNSVLNVLRMLSTPSILARLNAHHAGHTVDHEAQRLAEIDHQGARRVVVLLLAEAKDAA
jgi:hypothetical protein